MIVNEQTCFLPDDLEISLFTARSERLGPNSGAIRFFPDGSSTGGRLTLSTERLGMAVDVDWLTGKVRILEGDAQSLARSVEAAWSRVQ